ncbi:hypothetical protein FEM03_04890 [Phragmitibacter flavus]|uniref:Uncharacterized protein n=1 Tax=Phragmitibacter flavus TaxID=2576071 RepID=A0A5R8KJF4_9BACT|nr:hypothetical protein [Phragmitibacter flavus]TLD72065.1 hypothetical protein FEM03_04890 [Phragmitibacter flavus]
MKYAFLVLLAGCAFLSVVHSAEIPVFKVKAGDIENIVVDATPSKPWIFSITLTAPKLAQYQKFTEKNLNRQISLVVADVEIYQPMIQSVVKSNPLTFRMFEKKKFLSILAALPADPE